MFTSLQISIIGLCTQKNLILLAIDANVALVLKLGYINFRFVEVFAVKHERDHYMRTTNTTKISHKMLTTQNDVVVVVGGKAIWPRKKKQNKIVNGYGCVVVDVAAATVGPATLVSNCCCWLVG